jgi:hypothetical protein
MRSLRCPAALFLCVLSLSPLLAQKQKREPLTEAQMDQIAEAGINPDARIALYTKFIGEHADAIKALGNRAHSDARSRRLSDELQNLTALLDELSDNLDTYGERKADMRKSLKALNEAAPHWQQILRALAGEPGFDVARKEAIESCEDLSSDATRMLAEQTAYFKEHKDEAGQDRWEPK